MVVGSLEGRERTIEKNSAEFGRLRPPVDSNRTWSVNGHIARTTTERVLRHASPNKVRTLCLYWNTLHLM